MAPKFTYITIEREEQDSMHRASGRLLVEQDTRMDEFSFDIITESELTDEELAVQACMRQGIPLYP